MVFVFGVFVWMVTEREGLLWALFKHCSNCRSAGKAVPVPCFGGVLKSRRSYWRDRTEIFIESALCFI